MRQSWRGNNRLERERIHRPIWARELSLDRRAVPLPFLVVVSVGGRPLAVACRAVESGATPVRHGLCSVLERVYIVVPRFAVGLVNSRVVLSLPAAAALDVHAVAMGGGRAALPAVLAEGQALLAGVPKAKAAVTLVRAWPFEPDECAGNEVALRHVVYTRWE